MKRQTKLTAAALAAFAMAGCKTTPPGPSGAHGGAAQSSASGPATGASAPADGKKGECWGVNACKGQGACGGPEGHACAGQNACKGKGWLSLTETDCRSRNGKFKAG